MGWNSRGEYLPTTSAEHRIPSGDRYLYHVMPRTDFAIVMTEGLRPSQSGNKWDILHAYLDYVAFIENFDFYPESRSDCIFCSRMKKYGVNTTGSEYAMAVIDTGELDNSIYIANREKATEVAHALNEFGSTVLPKDDDSGVDDIDDYYRRRAYRYSVEYWDSCRPYEGSGDEGISEVLIESSVPEDAILTFYLPRDD